MSRQHFGMRVNIDASVHSLLQQHFEIAQIVAGDEDTWAGADTESDGGDLRIAVSGSVRLIEHSHSLHTERTGLKCKCGQLLSGERIIECCGKGALQEGIYIVVFF